MSKTPPSTSTSRRSAADRVRRVRRTVAAGSAAAFAGLWITVVGAGAGGTAAATTTSTASTTASTEATTATTTDDATTADQSLPAVQTGQS
jgi:hypothetical protein